MSRLEALIDKIIELKGKLPEYDYRINKFVTIHDMPQDFDGIVKIWPKATFHKNFKKACTYLVWALEEYKDVNFID